MHAGWTQLVDMTDTAEGELRLATPAEELRCLDSGSPSVSPLVHLGIIRVAGDDAAGFLHSQLTNAIEDMPTPSSRLAGWCNAKGRLLALLRVIRADDGYLLLLPRELIESLSKRLKMFVLRAKVTVTDASETLTVAGVAGEAAATVLAEVVGTPPVAGEVKTAGDVIVLRLPESAPRWLVITPAAQTESLWHTLTRAYPAVGPATWRLLDIRAGLPEVVAATQERFVPQMLNLEPLGGLSYEKGCYPGQEVVARMHYLGQLKRRLYRTTGDGEPPAPGARITADSTEAGEIVASARSGPGAFEALAVLRIDRVESGQQLAIDEHTLELQALPYPPPGADNSR